jgi:hypothetical protein
MFFNTNRLTKKQLRQQICLFARQIGVKKVIFNDKAKFVSGSFNAHTNVMFLSLNQPKRQMLHALFHELGHHEATQKNKWKKFHFGLYKNLSYDTLFKIENRIERLGKDLWNKYVNKKYWGNYKYFYLKSQKNAIINIIQAAK